MSLLERIHDGYVYGRRVDVLTRQLSELIPQGARVLDVGCGDGLIAHSVAGHRPDITVEGVDVLVRPRTHIPVTAFDGRRLPHPDKSFDAVMFVDVLHHTEDPLVLLRDAARVVRKAVVIKDHTLNGFLAGPTLRFMDWVGNARHGVVLPYNYWPEDRWREAFAALNWSIAHWQRSLKLYPWPANWIFERSLHFVARLELSGAKGG